MRGHRYTLGAGFPLGDLCLTCGLSVAAHPLLEKTAIVRDYRAGGEFKVRFDVVRASLKKVVRNKFGSKRVCRVTRHKVEVYYKLAFVELDTFTAKWGAPDTLKHATVKVASLKGMCPDAPADLLGVPMGRRHFPDGMPYLTVKIGASKYNELRNDLVDPNLLARVDQASELFTARSERTAAELPPHLRRSALKSAPTGAFVEMLHEAAQGSLRAEGQVMQQNSAAGTAGARLLRPGGADSDDEEKRAGGGRGRGGGRRRRATNTGPVPPQPAAASRKRRAACVTQAEVADGGLVGQLDDMGAGSGAESDWDFPGMMKGAAGFDFRKVTGASLPSKRVHRQACPELPTLLR